MIGNVEERRISQEHWYAAHKCNYSGSGLALSLSSYLRVCGFGFVIILDHPQI